MGQPMSTKKIAGGVGVAVAIALCLALLRGRASTSSPLPPAPGAALAPAPMKAAARALPAALENPIPSDAPQSPPEEVSSQRGSPCGALSMRVQSAPNGERFS